jgi:hypothetical protein
MRPEALPDSAYIVRRRRAGVTPIRVRVTPALRSLTAHQSPLGAFSRESVLLDSDDGSTKLVDLPSLMLDDGEKFLVLLDQAPDQIDRLLARK